MRLPYRLKLLSMSALMVLFLSFAPLASATNLVFDTAGNIVGNYVGPRSVIMDWVASAGLVGGAKTTGAITAATEAGALPLTGVATWAPAAVGKAARIGIRALGPVGAAVTAYQLYQLLQESGITSCSLSPSCKVATTGVPPQFIGSNVWQSDSTGSRLYSSAQAVCQGRIDLLAQGYIFDQIVDTGANPNIPATDTTTCYAHRPTHPTEILAYPYTNVAPVCPTGYSLTTDKKNCLPDVPRYVAASDADIESAVVKHSADDQGYTPRVLNALKIDSQNNPNLLPPAAFVPADLPVSVTGGSLTSPAREISRKTYNGSDGSPMTEVQTSQTTVTPVNQGGNTISTSNTVMQTTTTVTTTVTNNTTNVTNTTTTINNPPPSPADKQPGVQPDNSPKECGTPGRAKCQIDETGTPDGKAAFDQANKDIDAATKTATDAATASAKTAGDTSWKFGFTLPTGCTPLPMFLGVVADFCRFQPMIHDLMSLVWLSGTVFLLIGLFGRTMRGNA